MEWVDQTENVRGDAAIYVGEQDANGNLLGFATTQRLAVEGTTGWTQYSVTLPLNSQATLLYFGATLGGTGTAWVDDLQLLVDGQLVVSNPPVGFTSDHHGGWTPDGVGPRAAIYHLENDASGGAVEAARGRDRGSCGGQVQYILPQRKRQHTTQSSS